MAFNRDRSGGGGGFSKGGFRPARYASRSDAGEPRFNDRGGSRGPVEMHQAICDNCQKNCEVPFRPTSGKPIFCSSCFESQRGGSDSRGGGRSFDRPSFEEKRMFEAVCDECRNACKVPFQPSGDKPVYCSNCFGEKKGAGNNGNGQCQSQCKEQLEVLNNKLDKILAILEPIAVVEDNNQQPEEPVVVAEKVKIAKKKPSKKKI